MRKIAQLISRHVLATMLVVLVCFATIALLFWWRYKELSMHGYLPQPCSGYSGTFDSYGPGSVRALANEYSKAIVVAAVEDPEALGKSVYTTDPPPLIRVTQVLKSNGEIDKDDIIPICPGMGFIELPDVEHPTVLVFIEGKDGNVWVPSWGYFGIASQGRDGRFAIDGVTTGPQSVTVDELQKMIR